MKKFFKLLISSNFLLIAITNLTACSSGSKYKYYDDRTPLQMADANYLLSTKLKLNPDKHVLLIGVDGVPYNNMPEEVKNDSVFKSNYWIQNYETIYGWNSVLRGNVVDHKAATIFQLIKQNNSSLITANISQWMGNWFYSQIYGKDSAAYIDFNKDFPEQSNPTNYDTEDKMAKCFTDLLAVTNEKIAENYNFTFMYNTFFDELKHEHYFDSNSLIQYLLNQYNKIIDNLYKTLDSSKWLIISTTDHGRGGAHNFNHSMTDATAHYSWTLANNDLNKILGHNYTNFYDIRTTALKWLSS